MRACVRVNLKKRERDPPVDRGIETRVRHRDRGRKRDPGAGGIGYDIRVRGTQ